MSRVECIVANDAGGRAVEVVLMEPRPFRPFKSSEEYLIAMKEDLAEWLQRLYQLDIDAESFMHVLEDGVVLCKVPVTRTCRMCCGQCVKNRFFVDSGAPPRAQKRWTSRLLRHALGYDASKR